MWMALRMLCVASVLVLGSAAGCSAPGVDAVPVPPEPVATTAPGKADTSTSAAHDASRPADRPRAQPGISPELLIALQRAVSDSDASDAQIRIRVMTPDDCGPTVAPGSDCMVGTMAALDD